MFSAKLSAANTSNPVGTLHELDAFLSSADAAVQVLKEENFELLRELCKIIAVDGEKSKIEGACVALGCLRKLAMASENKAFFEAQDSSNVIASIAKLLDEKYAAESAVLEYHTVAALRSIAGQAAASVLSLLANDHLEKIVELAKTERILRCSDGRTLWTSVEASRLGCSLAAAAASLLPSIAGERELPAAWLWASVRLLQMKHASLKSEGAAAIVPLLSSSSQGDYFARLDLELVSALIEALAAALKQEIESKNIALINELSRASCALIQAGRRGGDTGFEDRVRPLIDAAKTSSSPIENCPALQELIGLQK